MSSFQNSRRSYFSGSSWAIIEAAFRKAWWMVWVSIVCLLGLFVLGAVAVDSADRGPVVRLTTGRPVSLYDSRVAVG